MTATMCEARGLNRTAIYIRLDTAHTSAADEYIYFTAIFCVAAKRKRYAAGRVIGNFHFISAQIDVALALFSIII